MLTIKESMRYTFIALIPFVFFSLLAAFDFQDLSAIDLWIHKALIGQKDSFFFPIIQVVTFTGRTSTLFSFTLLLSLLLYFYHQKALALWFFVTNLLGIPIFNWSIKYIVQRPRAVDRLVPETGFSFPSAHSTGSTIFYLSLFFLIITLWPNKKAKPFLLGFTLFWILLIIYTRLFLGVHYFSDVFSGFSLGLAWISFFLIFLPTSQPSVPK